MNQVILCGRLTGDPQVRYSQSDDPKAFASYALAVDRIKRKEEQKSEADFINCISFGKTAEFAEKFLKKGMKILVSGKLRTGSYTNKDGVKIHTTSVVVNEIEFASGGKKENSTQQPQAQDVPQDDAIGDGFMAIPDALQDEGLPFS